VFQHYAWKYSASVVRGDTTYIFFNDQNSNGDLVLKLMKVNDDDAPTATLRVDGKDVPGSDGPIAATIVNNGVDGIRLYVVNRKNIVEYGLDTPVGSPDKWKKESFTNTIKLDQGSFLNALGKPELGSIKSSGKPVLLRIFYTKEGASNQITQQSYTDRWEERTIES
jgi:hypothetical protein